jgi:hypothetical protein
MVATVRAAVVLALPKIWLARSSHMVRRRIAASSPPARAGAAGSVAVAVAISFSPFVETVDPLGLIPARVAILYAGIPQEEGAVAQSAAERYAELVHAAEAHQRRLAASRTVPNRLASPDASPVRSPDGQPDRWQARAARFREDPFRQNETLEALLSFIEPTDTVLDVGGGAGRYLPLALRCRELINVEPSPSMGAQFEAAVREAGISNARWLQSDWLGADVQGDVCFTANVIYYIADVVPFVAKLTAASRRRVMIVMHSLPPRNVGANLYRYIHDREPPRDPGHRELLPVLWDMGLLPEVRVLGPSDFIAERERYPDRDAAISAVLPAGLEAGEVERARNSVAAHFDELFASSPEGGYRRRPNDMSRVLLITWETQGAFART